jgi:hypothetical protein
MPSTLKPELCYTGQNGPITRYNRRARRVIARQSQNPSQIDWRYLPYLGAILSNVNAVFSYLEHAKSAISGKAMIMGDDNAELFKKYTRLINDVHNMGTLYKQFSYKLRSTIMRRPLRYVVFERTVEKIDGNDVERLVRTNVIVAPYGIHQDRVFMKDVEALCSEMDLETFARVCWYGITRLEHDKMSSGPASQDLKDIGSHVKSMLPDATNVAERIINREEGASAVVSNTSIPLSYSYMPQNVYFETMRAYSTLKLFSELFKRMG